MGAPPTRTAQVLRSLLALILALTSLAAMAADGPRELPAPVGAGGRAYLDAVGGSAAATGVRYFDPGWPAPALDVDAGFEAPVPTAPEQEATVDGGAVIGTLEWIIGAVFATVLILVLVLAARFGGARAVSFSTAPDRGSRPARQPAPGRPTPDPGPDDLAAIAAIADRQRALHILLERSLERATAATGQRIGRSQTARDVIRTLPSGWPSLPALGTIAAHAEVIQFGGRALTEEAFRSCVEAARQIFETTAVGTAPGSAGRR